MRYLILSLLLLSWGVLGQTPPPAVYSCNSQFSVSECKIEPNGVLTSGCNAGGTCNNPSSCLAAFGQTAYVKIQGNDFWVPVGNVTQNDFVFVAQGFHVGDPVTAAVCASLTPVKVSDITAPPPPVPNPPPQPSPTPGVGSVTLNWTMPTLKTDGSPQPLADIQKTTIFYGTDSANLNLTQDVPAPTTTFVFTGLTPVTWYFAATVTTSEGESDRSNVAFSNVEAPPPTALTGVDAFREVQNLGPTSSGDSKMVKAGVMHADTVCDLTQSLNTHGQIYYRVDRKNVTFSGNNQPPVVWAICL